MVSGVVDHTVATVGRMALHRTREGGRGSVNTYGERGRVWVSEHVSPREHHNLQAVLIDQVCGDESTNSLRIAHLECSVGVAVSVETIG